MRFLDLFLWKRQLPSSERFVIVHPCLILLAAPSRCHLRLCNPSVWRDHFLFGIHLRQPKCFAWLCYYWLNDGLLCPAEPDVRALESCDCDRRPGVGGIGGYNRIMAKCIQLCNRSPLERRHAAQMGVMWLVCGMFWVWMFPYWCRCHWIEKHGLFLPPDCA